MNGEEDPTPPRVPLQSATLNLAARQQAAADPEVTDKEENEAAAKARGLVNLVFKGTRYWFNKETDTVYEKDKTTSAVGKKVGKLLRTGNTAKLVSEEEYNQGGATDPKEAPTTDKEENEAAAKARGLRRIVMGGVRYWWDKSTNTVYELNNRTEAVGKKLGKLLREPSPKIVSDEEYAAAKK
jgi:hypothetical protein